MPPRPIPTPDDVAAIAALPDPVVRNLRITQAYHDFSAAMAARCGSAASWCTFATWASRQAGRTIRGEDTDRTVERALSDALAAPEAEAVTEALRALGSRDDVAAVRGTLRRALGIDRALARAATAVSRGNLKVFEEIGGVFATFVAERLGDPAFDATAIAAFQATLRPGDSPDGQEHLRRAFGNYYAARFAQEPKARAERVLLANLHIGVHEQTRLQPEITEALEAPVADPEEVVTRLLDAHLPGGAWLVRLRRALNRLLGRESPVDRMVARMVRRVRDVVRAQMTEHVMSLELPHGVVLRLGRDLTGPLPPNLVTLVDPELVALLAHITSPGDGTQGSGAADWAQFAERMHFIATLFRTHAEDTGLFEPPFTPEQAAALDAGRRPGGQL